MFRTQKRLLKDRVALSAMPAASRGVAGRADAPLFLPLLGVKIVPTVLAGPNKGLGTAKGGAQGVVGRSSWSVLGVPVYSGSFKSLLSLRFPWGTVLDARVDESNDVPESEESKELFGNEIPFSWNKEMASWVESRRQFPDKKSFRNT